MITVILTCWKRFTNFEKIIKGWLEEKENVDEIIIWDNSGSFKTDLPVIVINSNYNFGAVVRYMLSAIAKNEILLFCDDDILPLKGISEDFLKYFNENRILAVKGRFFKGSYESGFHNQFEAPDLNEPISVDFLVGDLMMIHRKHLLGINYRNYPETCCELYLQGELLPKNLEKLVIPTKNFIRLPEADDDNALYRRPYALGEKETIYQKFWGNKK